MIFILNLLLHTKKPDKMSDFNTAYEKAPCKIIYRVLSSFVMCPHADDFNNLFIVINFVFTLSFHVIPVLCIIPRLFSAFLLLRFLVLLDQRLILVQQKAMIFLQFSVFVLQVYIFF